MNKYIHTYNCMNTQIKNVCFQNINDTEKY